MRADILFLFVIVFLIPLPHREITGFPESKNTIENKNKIAAWAAGLCPVLKRVPETTEEHGGIHRGAQSLCDSSVHPL